MNRADRKKQLIAQGALYRAEVMLAKQAAHDAAQPQALLGIALPKIAFAALALIRSRNGGGLPAALQTVLPLATAAVAALAKRKPLLKAVFGGALAAGVAVLVMKRKRAAREAGRASSERVA